MNLPSSQRRDISKISKRKIWIYGPAFSGKTTFLDEAPNPINLNKLRGTRKELVKLKMGNKSKMHELFSEKPRNLEENEILKQKFMDFILSGKENNKNPEMNALKKSIVRKKIEDAQNFNKNK